MEIGWEPGQEAGHPLTGDQMISSCSRFPTEIKRSIKDQSLGWSLRKLLELHSTVSRGCSAPLPNPLLGLKSTIWLPRPLAGTEAAAPFLLPSCVRSLPALPAATQQQRAHRELQKEGLAVPQLEKSCCVPRGICLTTQKTRQQQIKQTQKNKESWQGIFSCDKTRPK